MSTQPMIDQQNALFDSKRRTQAIFIVSVVGLFLEMLLIRWIGTEVRIFAYLQNTILIACFLGLGIGCFTSRQPIQLKRSLLSITFLVLLLAIPISRDTFGRISDFLNLIGDMVIWGGIVTTSPVVGILLILLGLALTYALLIIIVDIFVPFGRLLGRLMDEHTNTIVAYSVNVAGSLLGTWLFVFLSFLYQPPFTWFIVFCGLVVILIIWLKQDIKLNLLFLLAILVLSWFAGLVPGSIDTIWSPYQKLVVADVPQDFPFGKYIVRVNNTGYQAMIDLSDSVTASDSAHFPADMRGLSQYDIPLLLHPNPSSFLIVGAGSGNDAAGGVRHGVKNITAVEIDPAIIFIGERFHPELPYSSPAVRVVNDDARSFFATTTDKFDVIAFSLLDSHTTTAMTNARLDHYVYTEESIARAKTLLAPGGVMVLTFEPQKLFIADRIAGVLQKTFQEKPLMFRIPVSNNGWGGIMFVVGDLKAVDSQLTNNPRLGAYIRQLQEAYPITLPQTTQLATDDWPYIYLDAPRIPILYYLLAGLMLLVLYRSCRTWQATNIVSRWHRSHWHFFFLGAAFLLLEVQNISKASVVLGNTWETNAVIVSGVLVMILLANWIAHTFPKLPLAPVYIAVIAIPLGLYFVDLAQFGFLPYLLKLFIVGSLTTLPMLFSGIIFVRSFAAITAKDEALGANMVGSLVGALLQSVTFIVGIKALLLIVMGMYILALVFKPRSGDLAVST
jgi:spermidine synthase